MLQTSMIGWKASITLNHTSQIWNVLLGRKFQTTKPFRLNHSFPRNTKHSCGKQNRLQNRFSLGKNRIAEACGIGQKFIRIKMTSKEYSNPIDTAAEDIAPEVVDEMLSDALVWASLNGLVTADKTNPRSGMVPGVGLVHGPFSLLPAPFPEVYWNQALELAPLFNEVIDRVSNDGDFLQETLTRAKEFDDFTARLLKIHSIILDENIEQSIQLGINRSDYMLDTTTREMLQVELNTISTSSSGTCSRVCELHRHLIDSSSGKLNLESKYVPENLAIQKSAEALALAWKEFNDRNSVILVVALSEEHNMYDQHWILMELKRSFGISTIRKTLSEINAEGELKSDGTLHIGGKSVAVVYFRAGYSPDHYPTEAEWEARLMLEKSSAVKCPSISYHLAGTKKIQQELAKDGVLERFVDDKEAIVKLRKCFAGLWGLDDDKSVIKDAISKPDLYVLKPQREGGGNNLYGNDLKEKLLEIERKGSGHAVYILMQRLFPPIQKAYMVRNGICQLADTVSEFGIFSIYLRNKDKVIRNEQAGYLMKSKVSTANEGGIIAGISVLNSVYIV